ncbi:MAG TPA: YggS family pyridoxal phosphate-dependent enzyme [Syntrophales bacterium]|nr:YggS family pyridoxal phosphate-dependent enzyme [Syntrophales bacterium]HQN76860.1 YggS family pyridoxal phosphate-dependent enzyme [Syntrophales bacterium]HQQ26682.1 YggS family pyridoxal phosphate-dependent enzyme [Syntrophales bacterium]
MTPVHEAVREVRRRIAEAALRKGRDPAGVRLMAVTKTVDDVRIREAVDAGVDILGENYVQEAKRKIASMGRKTEWHLIGHLQSNKAKYAVRLFDLVHSVDRPGLAAELDKRSRLAGVVTPILIQVSLSGEETKGGISPEEAESLVREVAAMEHLSVRGLMTMPPWFDDPEQARPFFRALRELRDRILEKEVPGVSLGELSMGMTQDYEVAVEEGATIVRVGRALFGDRPA